MIKINVFSEEKSWSKKLKDKESFFKKICQAFPKKYKFLKKEISFSLLLSNNLNIKRLNKQFRNNNKATDILSFPFDKKPFVKKNTYLGDIIISYEFINIPKSQTLLQFKKKLIKIFIHGFLHLLNYDHVKFKDFKKMSDEEKKIYNFISKNFEKFI